MAPSRANTAIAAGLEPATVGSEVQRSSIEPRDRQKASDIPSHPGQLFLCRARNIMCGHSLVVRTPRRGRGNPGSIPGDRFYAPAEKVDDEGFEPSTFRMQNGRSTTELNAQQPAGSVV